MDPLFLTKVNKAVEELQKLVCDNIPTTDAFRMEVCVDLHKIRQKLTNHDDRSRKTTS